MLDADESRALRWRLLFLRRALRKRCPQCGRGALFRGFARLHVRCGECGLVYRRESGSQTGSMYLSAAVTELFAALVALALFFATDWSKTVALTVGVAVVLAFSYLFLPISMAAWVAVEYATDFSNGESWAQPRG
jgi:uncharacterized protein (DUF983 family)